jgi:hypothetical protein
MKGILRFDINKDNWFIDYEEHFRILKDDKGQAYGAETTTVRVQVEPHSCPDKYPTSVLKLDGTEVNFELTNLDPDESGIERVFGTIVTESVSVETILEEDEDDDSYSPYCPVCSGCGESGCCSPLHCEPDNPECHYPKTYTADLKLGYSTWSRFWDLLEENQWFGKKKEFMKIYDEELDIRFGKDEE